MWNIKTWVITLPCRVFLDAYRNQRIDFHPTDILTFGDYHPKHQKKYKEMDPFSIRILNIKKDGNDMPDEYHEDWMHDCRYFSNGLSSILSKKNELVICVMPSHTEGYSTSGVRMIAKLLLSANIIDGTELLTRVYDIPEKSIGGLRDFNSEICSLSVNNSELLLKQQVLLLDDITTTGTSLWAGKEILLNAGAELVAMYALGKTVH